MQLLRPSVDSVRAGFRFGPLLPVLVLVLALLALGGCGGGDSGGGKDDVVLATVGDHPITADYYEAKLSKLERKELPRGDDGMPLDMSTLAGKREFLETLINKELMARKATDLGYGNDNQVKMLRESVTSYEANLQLWNDVVNEPTSVISPEDLEAFYARMGEVRDCNFVLTNTREDAEAARAMAQSGADWDDVVAKYHDGTEPPSGKYQITIPFGRYNMNFDTDVFSTEVGDVAPPIMSEYGFWVLKVNRVRDTGKPDLEEAKPQILDVFRNRLMALERKKFIESVREKFEFYINEDALMVAFAGLPEDEVMLNPETNQPTPREELKDLDIAPKDLDMTFYGYKMDGKRFDYTIRDYKTHFDRMSVFQRPKRGEMLGGMRQKITQEIDKALLNREAELRGYFEHPDVVAKVKDKAEEVMVTKLYDEVVTFDDKVTAEELDAFWADHEQDYAVPELRSGRMVICLDEKSALAAREFIMTGPKWKEVLTRFGVDQNNKSRSGKLDQMARTSINPASETMFAMDLDEVSQPVAMGAGRYAIVRLEKIEPGRQQSFEEVREAIGQRIRNQRREDSFHNLLSQWATEYGVTRYEDQLANVASWKELTQTETPGQLIPR